MFAAPALVALAVSLAASAQMAQVYSSCSKPNTVGLSFDDGPWVYETDIVNRLNAMGVKATFFVNGNNYECIYDSAMATAVRNTFQSGHEFGSHTWQHMDLTTLTFDQIHNQMYLTEQSLNRLLGVQPAMMRPPYGNYNDLVRQVAAQRNQSLILWDFDDGDSTGSTVAQSEADYDQLISQHPNNVLTLNHETYQTTADDVIPYAVPKLLQAGYQVTTVSDCLGIQPYQYVNAFPPSGCSYSC